MSNVKRCPWVNQDPLYQAYHDEEWGKPTRDKRILFEMICLEGQQAGLSWYTILKKREGYRELFHQFDPYKIAQMDGDDVERLMKDPKIIRNRAKINSIINNAKIFIQMEEDGEDFSEFIWRFVDGKTIENHVEDISNVPVSTEISDELSKALKKKGFKFLGTVTCYAFMQSVGMVNDHSVDCSFRKPNTK